MRDVDVDLAETDETAQARRLGRASRRFGHRSIARARVSETSAPRSSRWRVPSVPSIRRRSGRGHAPVSAAARRRRIVALLALATLATAAGVAIATLAGVPVPTWLVAIPGGLMVAYLVLLAVVRPGAPSRDAAEPISVRDEWAGEQPSPSSQRVPATVVAAIAPEAVAIAEAGVVAEAGVLAEAAVLADVTAAPAPAAAASAAAANHEPETAASAENDTWTPVPLPTPTYVNAPRARSSVRTIDLSNPGSWTSSAAPAAPAAASSEAEQHDDYLVEHRRAVGD